MSKHSRDRRPYLPPITRIELSEKNIMLRWILLAVFLAIGVIALIMGMRYAVNTEPGWQEVEVTSREVNCSRDFVFLYECGGSGMDPTAEYRGVTTLYSSLTESAYRLFSPEAVPEASAANLSYLNSHVNETVTVDPGLYKALEQICSYGSRYPFLAPVTAQYAGVFLSSSDGEAALYDPNFDPERMAYVREAVSFSSDPDHVRLELKGENRVCLFVSPEYLDYAGENEISSFLDLGWMKNAFIADYLAAELTAAGYTNGSLASFDGFTRNLDLRETGYAYNLFDRLENTVSIPGELKYSGKMSIVFLRNYPLSEEDQWHYYAYEDGTITGVYLDPKDGVSRSSTDNLVAYSRNAGCAEILLRMAPVFIADTLDREALGELEAEEIHSIWAEDTVLYHTQEEAVLNLLPDSGGANYRIQIFQ